MQLRFLTIRTKNGPFQRNVSKLFPRVSTMGSSASLPRKAINRQEFYSLPDAEILKRISELFPAELERLKKAYASEKGSSPELQAYRQTHKLTPSEILYDKNFDEINRTLTGILALRWIHNDEYDIFVSGQAPKVKLRRESFRYLQNFFNKHIKTDEDLFALVLSMVVNDLGKDPDLEREYFAKTGDERIIGQNHDTILLEAAKAGMVPSLDMLSEKYRGFVMLGLELGSQLNAGQLAQAENVPVNLEGLLEMRGHYEAFHLKYMEQILDVAGAAAHYDPRGARNLIEPVFQGFRVSYEVSLAIISDECTLRQGYDKILTNRAKLLHDAGFRRLSVSDRVERALLRLLTMGRTTTKEQANLFDGAFEQLDPKHREDLVAGLNIDGIDVNETAVLPYYMPAMIAETLDNTRSLEFEQQQGALTALMRYLSRVIRINDTGEIQNMPEHWRETFREQQRQMGVQWEDGKAPGIVIERNMMKARETINSIEFKENPSKLDELEIPRGQVLQRRRTSHSLESQPIDPRYEERKQSAARTPFSLGEFLQNTARSFTD